MKKKKRIITIAGLLLVAIVGATFAYYTSNTTFENVFNAGKYKVTLTEVFESPDNWVPGETVPKTVKAKNDGTVPAAVRISYTEQWLQEIDGVETDITTQVTPNPAIINFDNQGDWTSSDGYYYYKYILEPTDETSSFISGVTLDPNLDSVTCTGEGNEKTCEAQNPASGAKYKLTFTIQTVQYDQYENVWNTNVEIANKPSLTLPTGRTKDNLQVGDEVCANGTDECFYFIRYDGSNNEDLVLLAKYDLNVGFSPEDGEETYLQDSRLDPYNYYNGGVRFAAEYYWAPDYNLDSKYGDSFPAYVYDSNYGDAPQKVNGTYVLNNYSIAYYVETYKNILINQGVPVKSARLISYEEVTDASIGCVGQYSYSCPQNTFITSTSYWTGSAKDQDDVWTIISSGSFTDYGFSNDTLLGVRPVIVIPKSNA